MEREMLPLCKAEGIKPEHLRDAVASLELKLTREEVAELEAPYVPHAVAGFV